MKFTESAEIDRAEPEQANKYTARALQNIESILNNGLGFSDNFDAKLLTITFSAADTNVAALHGLGRIPSGYFVVGQSAACVVYDGSSANTTSVLYLRSSVVGTVRLWVY